MNKIEAVEVLKEIKDVSPFFDTLGFYTREIRFSPTNEIELRLLTTLDPDMRRLLEGIIKKRKMKMIEEEGLLIIY